MRNTETLQSIGLSKWESQTYLALLELGETKTGELSKKSEVPQSKIYSVLDSLIERGLVSHITKGQIKFFQASDPKRVLALFKEKEDDLQSLLENISIKKEEKSSVEIFQGFKAIRVMLASLIEDAKNLEEFYGFSTGETSTEKEIEEFYEWWGERKRASGLNDQLLISEKNKKEFEANILKEDLPYVKKKTKYSKVSFPGDVAIFRNNVILFNYENIPQAILIKNQEISKQYTEFFLSIWKQAK